MSWARSFYLKERSSLYKYKRIMSSHFCFKWSLWSFSSKMSEMSIMLIMLTVITSDSSDQSNHFKTLITQWLANYCCYIISCKRVLTSALQRFVVIYTSSLQFLLLILESFSDLSVHLNWLREERCLCYSACKKTWSDFVNLLTCLLFFKESA